MKNKFNCPLGFDIVSTAKIFNPWKKEETYYYKEPVENVEVHEVTKPPEPVILGAYNKLWKPITFPFRLEFEKLEKPSSIPERVEFFHIHTEFILSEKKIHIEYLKCFTRGPIWGQVTFQIYVDDVLCTNYVDGGNSFGFNWRLGREKYCVREDFILEFNEKFAFETSPLVIQPEGKDFPLKLYVPFEDIKEIKIELFDFRESEGFKMMEFLNSLKTGDLPHVFLRNASEDKKRAFFNKIGKEIIGHPFSAAKLKSLIDSMIVSEGFGCEGAPADGLFYLKKTSFNYDDFILTGKKAEVLKNYLIFKYSLLKYILYRIKIFKL